MVSPHTFAQQTSSHSVVYNTLSTVCSTCNREHITAEETEIQSQAESKGTLETSLCDRLLENL